MQRAVLFLVVMSTALCRPMVAPLKIPPKPDSPRATAQVLIKERNNPSTPRSRRLQADRKLIQTLKELKLDQDDDVWAFFADHVQAAHPHLPTNTRALFDQIQQAHDIAAAHYYIHVMMFYLMQEIVQLREET